MEMLDTTEKAKTIAGDELYQKRAREALPLLVEYAKSNDTVSYSVFAHRMGMDSAIMNDANSTA
jgi:hypothetical protein